MQTRRLSAFLVAALVVSPVPGSCAQVVQNLATGGSATLDGLTLTVSGCNSSSTAGLCGNVMLELTDSPGHVAAEFLGNGGAYGSNVLSVSNGSLQYLWFTLTVSSPRPVTALSGAVTGTGYNNTQVNNAASGCTVTGGWSTGIYCAAYAYNGAPTQTAFTGVNKLNISYTLGIQGTRGQALVLNNASSVFNDVPEPGALAAMASGLAGLFAVRCPGRRRARPTCLPLGPVRNRCGRLPPHPP
jgi:hypothetical protein